MKVGEYTGTVGFESIRNGARRGNRLMFSSTEDGKLLHTVDGTNNVAVRIDDIEAEFFAVPSYYTEEKIFIFSFDGYRSRTNYDYVVEIFVQTYLNEGPVHEIKGTNTLVLSISSGKYVILDFDLNELLTYDKSIAGMTDILHDVCVIEGTA